MKDFRDKYCEQGALQILDVGSKDINGSYKSLFAKHFYFGLDIVRGKNVDFVGWGLVQDNSMDVVISGQTLEHVKKPELLMRHMARVMKPGGYCCIIAPSAGPVHCMPDYRRYQPEDLKILAEQLDLRVLELRIDFSECWEDCMMVAQKCKN